MCIRDRVPVPAAVGGGSGGPGSGSGADAAGALAAQIARAWEEVLGIPVTGTEQVTFFDLGGNSLSVLRLSRALGRIAGRTLPIKQVYRCGTIPQQVELLSQQA